jgi:hypothetical protein
MTLHILIVLFKLAAISSCILLLEDMTEAAKFANTGGIRLTCQGKMQLPFAQACSCSVLGKEKIWMWSRSDGVVLRDNDDLICVRGWTTMYNPLQVLPV